MPQREAFKQQAVLRKLPEMYKEFRALKKQADEMNKLSFFGKIKKLLGF